MSKNRENVVWQSADGSWSRGFFETYPTKSYDDEDYDDEWDVDYDNFSWVSVGHPTEEAARAAWDGANPGGSTAYAFGEGVWSDDQPVAGKFDEMAVACAAAGNYARGVSAAKVQDYKDRAAISRFYFTQRSYDYKAKKLSPFFAAADDEDVKKISRLLARRPELADYARECKQKVIDNGERQVEEARKFSSYGYGHRARSSHVAGTMAVVAATKELLDRVKIPAAPKTTTPAGTGAARGKTTAASTPGSFAPKVGAAPEVSLGR